MDTRTLVLNGNLEKTKITVVDELLEKGRPLQGSRDVYIVGTLLDQTHLSILYHGKTAKEQKVVIKEFLYNDHTRSFERESLAASRASHPHIRPAYEFMVELGRPLGIFPFIEGRTLDEVIREEGPMDQEKAVSIVDALSKAADHIHDLSIVHRDIKPSNVIIAQPNPGEFVPYLFDFGIAGHPFVAVYDHRDAQYATLEYMAPEKCIRSAPARTEDIYSLAVLTYELLSGKLPYESNSPDEVFRRYSGRRKMRVPNLIEDNFFIDYGISQAVEKGMNPDPEKRFQTAGEFGQALVEALRK